MESSSWEQERALIIKSLDRMDESIKDLTQEIKEMREDYGIKIAMLQVKAGVWGVIGGIIVAVPVAIAIVEAMTRR